MQNIPMFFEKFVVHSRTALWTVPVRLAGMREFF